MCIPSSMLCLPNYLISLCSLYVVFILSWRKKKSRLHFQAVAFFYVNMFLSLPRTYILSQVSARVAQSCKLSAVFSIGCRIWVRQCCRWRYYIFITFFAAPQRHPSWNGSAWASLIGNDRVVSCHAYDTVSENITRCLFPLQLRHFVRARQLISVRRRFWKY